MIDDATFNALCEKARMLPNLAVFAADGSFVRFASGREVVNAATIALEGAWHIEIDTNEYNVDDEKGIIDAYVETHITAAVPSRL